MSQKKVYLYSPDGESEGWHMEDKAPPGWLINDPNAEQTKAEVQADKELESDLEEAAKQMDDLDAKQAAEAEELELAKLKEELEALEAAEKPPVKQKRKNN